MPYAPRPARSSSSTNAVKRLEDWHFSRCLSVARTSASSGTWRRQSCHPNKSTYPSSGPSRHIRSPAMPDEPESEIRMDEALRDELATQLAAVARALPDRINADPERVEQGLARLVLTVIEVVRKVLEHQAVRRMDGGDLTAEEVERLGLTLLRLDERMQQMKGVFGLTDEDLQIDLGPLGRLR